MPNYRNCDQPVETWQDWFSGDCATDPLTGHYLPWPEIILLPGWDISMPSKLVPETEAQEKMK